VSNRLGAALLTFFFVAMSVGCETSESIAPTEQDQEDALGAVAEVSQGDSGLTEDNGRVDLGPLLYNPCSTATKVGGFEVTLAEKYTGVSGQVLDGVVPAQVPELAQEEGECSLWVAKSLFCDPACVPGETCGESGSCIPYPESHSVGTVIIDGLIDPLTMEAKWGNHYTNPGTMAHPGYEDAALISLQATGGDFEPFALRGVGVQALEVSETSPEVVVGAGLTVSWLAAQEEPGVSIHLELNINNHGSSSAWIACDVTDSGTYTISSALIEALFDKGVSGFPSLAMTRQSVDSTTIGPGCVQLVVASAQALSVNVEGVTSCTSDAGCPNGQACGADLQCH
jgi:hypothetical protein